GIAFEHLDRVYRSHCSYAIRLQEIAARDPEGSPTEVGWHKSNGCDKRDPNAQTQYPGRGCLVEPISERKSGKYFAVEWITSEQCSKTRGQTVDDPAVRALRGQHAMALIEHHRDKKNVG